MSNNANRPEKIEDFLGQENIVKQVEITTKSCKFQNIPFPHMAMGGPPGLGKTTLAKIIANEMGGTLISRISSAITKPEDLFQLFSNIEEINTIIFLDEIEQLDRKLTELLHTALEDNVFTAKINDKIIDTQIPEFSLIGATNYLGELPRPFIDRFRLQVNFKPYTKQEICSIIIKVVKKRKLKMTKDASRILASRSRGVPRIAIRYIENALDVALAVEDFNGIITSDCTMKMFEVHNIDNIGLTELDRRLLDYLAQNDKPVGLKTLSQSINEDKSTVEFSEAYLLQLGFIQKESRGRVITDLGRQHLKENSLCVKTLE